MENFELKDKTYRFANRAVKLHKYLQGKYNDNKLAAYLLDEALKMGVAAEQAASVSKGKMFLQHLQEANSHLAATRFCIRLLRDAEYLDNQQSESLLSDCSEIEHMLSGILGSVQVGTQ